MSSCARDCPYLGRVERKVGYVIEAYCYRSSAWGLRVPSTGEFLQFCTSGDYHRCPVYRFATGVNEPEIEEECKGWKERLRELRLSSLQVQGEAQERYQDALRDLTAKVEALQFQWQQIREGRLHASQEGWQRIIEAIENLEWAYGRVAG